MLAFGWLFMSPAYSDDPLTIAAKQIENLNKAVDKLDYKDNLINLIDIAENKFMSAKDMKDTMNFASKSYDDALTQEADALSAKISAKNILDLQKTIVDQALQNKNNAQDALDLANINLSTAQATLNNAEGAGLKYDVYSLIRLDGQATPDQFLCSGTLNGNYMTRPVCGNRYENFIVKFTGKITVPSWFTSTKFAGYTDDGFKMYIDGELAINNWREQGTTWSAYSPVYDVTSDKVFDVEIWWYNGGGPGSYHLGWAIPGGWTGAGCDYAGDPRVWGQNFSCNLNTFSSGSGATQEQTNDYNNALAAKNSAQQDYNDKLTIYNAESITLDADKQNFINKTSEYNNSVINTANNLDAKTNTNNGYNNQLNDLNNAIDDAWRYYDEQLQRELNAAIAQAAANSAAIQPTPEPKPTVEPPKPKPSAQPTIPSDEQPNPKPTGSSNTDNSNNNQNPGSKPDPKPTPAPEPKPEPTLVPAPEPKPEPSLEPAPEPSVIPSPEPKPLPRPDFKPAENIDPVIKNAVLAALIPEKGTGTSEDLSGVIANLTSKDNKLVKLSSEQTAAVSQTLKALTQEAKTQVAENLGISASEVAKVADQMKSNPALAAAFVAFNDKAAEAGNTTMPFTLADAVTEVQADAFLQDPLGSVFNVNPIELLSNFSELGKDMTNDQREKAQEVVVPVVIVSQIAGAMIRRNK
jgi:hypothetical protein